MIKLLIALAFVHSSSALAADNIFTSPDFVKEDFKTIMKDLSGAFSHTTNSGGANLGTVFGVEAGIVAGAIEADNFKGVAERLSGQVQEDLKYLPSGGIAAGIALPMGFGAELSMIPNIDFKDGSFSNTSLAARWSVTDMFPLVGSFSPIKIALRGSYGIADLHYNFSLTANDQEQVDIKLKSTEIGAVAGFNLIFLEPYIALSSVESKGELDAIVKLSAGGFNQSTKIAETADHSGMKTALGILFKMPLIRIGLEYSTLNSVNRYTAKIALKF